MWKHALKLGTALVAVGIALTIASYLAKIRERDHVEAAYKRFTECFAGVSPEAPYGNICGAKVQSMVLEPMGFIQRCVSNGNFSMPWFWEEGLEPPTYSAILRCDPDGSVIFAEITSRDKQWSVTTVGHTRAVN